MIEKVLALSTAHMPSESPDFGGVATVKFDFGYVAWVTESSVPAWLAPVMQTAVAEGCTLILFDRDAATEPEFPVYEWEQNFCRESTYEWRPWRQ